MAVCSYTTGQEVTFYYSDDCEDSIVANYGFLHPMIPRCASLEDLKSQNMQLSEQVEMLTGELMSTQNKLMAAEKTIQRLRNGCNFGDSHELGDIESSSTHTAGVRGNKDDTERSEGNHGRIRLISRRSMEDIGF